LRRPPGQATALLEDHDELSILDELGLSDDNKSHIRLKTLLTDPAAETVAGLAEHIKERLVEGHGECLFDVGLEDSGDSMGFTRENWECALERIRTVGEQIKVDFKLLMTRNVGGDVEVGPRDVKDTGYSGKMILRRRPESVDDVIETRIAVVGNGESPQAHPARMLIVGSRCWQKYHVGSLGQRRPRRRPW
jgi:GTPase